MSLAREYGLTACELSVDEALGLDLGADDYIAKPFSQQLLAKRVKAVLRRSQGDSAAGAGEGDQKPLVRGSLVLDPNRHACTWNGKPVPGARNSSWCSACFGQPMPSAVDRTQPIIPFGPQT